jgi:hypothetical protein
LVQNIRQAISDLRQAAEIDSAKDKANKNACRYEYIVAQNKQG